MMSPLQLRIDGNSLCCTIVKCRWPKYTPLSLYLPLQVIPRCPQCPATDAMAIMKPDIVFFGESLPREFHDQMELDKDVCDLIIVVGSSLKVRPVALIPSEFRQGLVGCTEFCGCWGLAQFSNL